jgi:hypothetical protein
MTRLSAALRSPMWSNTVLHQHFTVDEDAARRRLKAALDLWVTWKHRRSGHWIFSGEALGDRIKVRAAWQYEPSASVALRGVIVPTSNGESDFVGEIGATKLERGIVVLAVLLVVGEIGCLLVWAPASLIGDHSIAHQFRWAPGQLGILGFFMSFYSVFFGNRRRQHAGLTAAQALQNWLSECATSAADEPAAPQDPSLA